MPNTDLRIVYIKPPSEKRIKIEDINEKIRDYLINDFPSDLDCLSSHTMIEDVSDVDISKIHVSHDGINIIGTCSIDVSLQYDSESDQKNDDGVISSDSFPATFDITFDFEMNIEAANINVDTSEFFED